MALPLSIAQSTMYGKKKPAAKKAASKKAPAKGAKKGKKPMPPAFLANMKKKKASATKKK